MEANNQDKEGAGKSAKSGDSVSTTLQQRKEDLKRNAKAIIEETQAMCEPMEEWEELDKRKLRLQYDRPSDFVISQWPILPWPVFAFYRLVIAAYTVSVFVLILARYDWYLAMFWWAYYMYWSHALLMTAAVWGFVLTLFARYMAYSNDKKKTETPGKSTGSVDSSDSDETPESRQRRIRAHDETTPLREPKNQGDALAKRIDEHYAYKLHWSFKAFWVIRTIGYNQVLVTGVFFWTLLTDYMSNQRGVLAAHQSIVNTLVVVVDSIISPAPIFFLHAWQPILFASVYILVTVLFWFLGQDTRAKPFFFKVLDYGRHPVLSAFVIIFLITVMIPTAQFVLLSLCNLRKFFLDCMRESKYCSCAGCNKGQKSQPQTKK